MNISYFEKGQYTKTGETGEVINLNMLINKKTEKNIKYKDKGHLPFIQGQSSGIFMTKDDILNMRYYDNWEGCCFMDIDSPKHNNNEVCSWWTDTVIYNRLDDLALLLSKYKWFIGISISGGGHGWHVLGQIKSRWNSETEYMATYIQIYNDIYSELLGLFKDHNVNEIKKMCDGHNIYPYQKFFIGGKKFYINNNFDEENTLSLNNYDTDDEYLLVMKRNCDIFIVNQVMDQFNRNIINARVVDINKSKIDKVIYTTKYNINKYKPLYIDGVPYFNNVYRFMLVKTLKCFFNKQDTEDIALNVYDTYWKSGHDKTAAHNHIKQLINNEEPFEVKDWFIDVLIKLQILSEKPKYDKFYDMDEMHIDYLSDVMPDIIKNSGDITIIDSPVASGKTTSIKKLSNSLWMAEPYNPVIKNNFEGLSDRFQCLYDDIQFNEKEFTLYKNKIASSYNKLINIDNNIFIDKKIEYLFIDESHTIFSDCEFRSEVMYNLVNKIISIAKLGVKVFLMTGTPLKEKELFGSCCDLDIKYIKVKRKHRYNKELYLYKYNTEMIDEEGNEKKTGFILENFIANKINEYRDKGYKILIPTNKGDKKIEKIISKVSALNGYSVCDEDFNIYKRDYRNEVINKVISQEGNMNNNIVFCTTYLSVGVSINNREPACIIFFGKEWTAYQIEQYACRFRNTNITVLWIMKNDNLDIEGRSFKLIKIPSEEEIETVIECTKRELNYRGWENWDSILKRTLDAYPGIIKENMFEMNELYYDRTSLYLSWYVYSLQKYYTNIMNNIKELHEYSFNITEEEINNKTKFNVDEKNKLNEIEYKINQEQGKKLLQWIDYLSEYYFIQGKLEMNFYGEVINKEPYISFHRFAMYCWYNKLTIDCIKNLLRSFINEYDGYVNNNKREYERCLTKINTAKKSIEHWLSKLDSDKNKKIRLKTAQEKLEREEKRLSEMKCIVYDIRTSRIQKIKQLIRIMKHYNLGNISRLINFTKENVDKMIGMKIDEVVDEISVQYNKIVNAPKYIDYTKYQKELKYSIRKFIEIIYNIDTLSGQIYNSEWSIELPEFWFEIDKNRSNTSMNIHKDVMLLINDLETYN